MYDSEAHADRARSPWLLLAAIAVVWAWYCHHWPYLHTANEAMRLYFVQAVVEDGRPELDRVVARHQTTPVDRSEFNGHIYMDKAPGVSLLVLPLYPGVRAIWPDVATAGLWRFGYIATLVGAALPLLLALALLSRYLAAIGTPRREAAWTVAALGTASPLLPYATLFFGHALAAACIAVAFFAIARPSGQQGAGTLRAWAAGLSLGAAGLTDTPVFVLAALVAVYGVVRAAPLPDWTTGPRDWRWSARLRRSGPILAGLALGAAAQLAYNTWTLGHPLHFTYQYKGDRQLAAIMSTGFLGFRPPQLDALVGLLFTSRRGLLYHAPWLMAAVVGLVRLARNAERPPQHRLDALASLVISGLYVLLVAGFADWRAGDSPGPRHLLPVIALVGWGLGPLLAEEGKWWVRSAVAAALAVAVLLHVPIVATFPYHFEQIERPVLELDVPLLVRSEFSPSIGTWLGLPPMASFLVFLTAIAGVWALAWRTLRDSGQEPTPAWQVRGMAAAILTMWLAVLASFVPEAPKRAAEVGRYRAGVLLRQGEHGAARPRPMYR